ncbi:MAG: hypothetical protein NZ839_03395, partial [Endomicrobia bacterium]|nr:hypothetical protein [Endomicrobiia bacterium]
IYSGDRYQVQLYFLNEGTITWTTDKTKLVTVNPRGRQSVFYDSTTWISSESISFVKTNVPPNSQYIFSFYIKAPQVTQQTKYTEYFNLFQIGAGYFSDFGGPADTEVKLSFTVYPKSSGGEPPPPGGNVGEFDLSDIIVSKSTFVPVAGENITISYYVKLTSTALQTLKIYNYSNIVVKTLFENSVVTAGDKSVIWDGRDNNGEVLPSGKYKISLKLIQDGRSIEKFAFVNIYSDKPLVTVTPLDSVLNIIDTGIKTKVYINSSAEIVETKSIFYLYSGDLLKATIVQELVFSPEQFYYTVLQNLPTEITQLNYEILVRDIYNSSTVVKSEKIKIVPSRVENINLVNGGVITLTDGNPDDGQTTLEIFPQRKYMTLQIKLEKLPRELVPPAIDNNFIETGVDYPVAAYKVETIPEIDYFPLPVKLSFLYPDIDDDSFDDVYHYHVNKLRIFCYKNSQWELVGGVVNNKEKIVSSNVQHFSIFALFPIKEKIILDAKYFKPEEKIISVKHRRYISFKNISNFQPDVEIKIYDIKGRLIKTVVNKDVWDLTDNNNSLVPSGSYVYKYKYKTQEITGIITIIR